MDNKESLSSPFIPWLAACCTVFVSSACIMVLELTAGRIIARHIGVSLYTWTAVIGVIMLGMALGNHLGGRFADRYVPSRMLALLFLSAAGACFLILPLNSLAGMLHFLGGAAWPLRIFLHVSLVFLVPALLLGMIPPVVVKMALDLHRKAGRTVGSIFAWGVGGSLLGTFITGYYLVMVWNASTILFVSGGGLGILGAAYSLHSLRHRSGGRAPCAHTPAPDKAYEVSRFADWAPAAATVFLSNTAFMAFELGVSRLIAREFGSSLYTWTMVIGLVLAGITFGNSLGGRLADRSFSNRTVAAVFSLSALTVMLSPVWNGLVRTQRSSVLFLALLSWPMQIGLQVAALCFIPCLFIGMISPLLVRRALDKGMGAGASVGMIYAWGSLGGIFGTFLSGYWLIQWMGALPMTLTVALSLAAAGVLYKPRHFLPLTAMLLSALFLGASFFPRQAVFAPVYAWIRTHSDYANRTIYEDESQYSYIAILKDEENPDLREMLLDQLVHSCIDMTDPTHLLYEYEWVYDSVLEKRHPRPQPLRTLVIGGGGYAYPHHLEKVRPGSSILVSEIDPAVTRAAHAALGLPENTQIDIRDMDARNVVDDLLAQKEANPSEYEGFDYIFGDSINDYTVPYHLTTLEFNRRLHSLLKEDGMYLFNMIDLLDSGDFLSAVVHTCRQVFADVAVFNTGRASFVRDTFVVVCAKQPVPLDDIPARIAAAHAYIGTRIPNVTLNALIERNGSLLLTDNFAPVENLLAPVVRTRAGDPGELYLAFARRDNASGNTERAMKRCMKALSIHPQWPEAREFLAQLRKQSGDREGTIEALAEAVNGHAQPAVAWSNLAAALLEAQRTEEAMAAWQESVRIRPDYVFAWYNLGVLYGMRQEIPEAIACWKKAVETNPGHGDSLYNLAAASLMLGDPASAQKYVEQMKAHHLPVDAQLLAAIQQQSGATPSEK